MNLIPIDLDIPEAYLEINRKIQSLEPKGFCTIAGGCLSNLYMKRPINDIDVFVDYTIEMEKLEKVFGVPVEIVNSFDSHVGYTDQKITIPTLYHLEYKGYNVEIIISRAARVHEFDLRFRQFYLYNEKVYTTSEALQDIQNKEIVVVTSYTPLSTWFRVLRFREELGFKIRKESMKFIFWFFNQTYVDYEKAKRYVEKRQEKVSMALKEKMLQWIEKNNKVVKKGKDTKHCIRVKRTSFPFHPSIKKLLIEEFGGRQPNWDLQPNIAVNYDLIEQYRPASILEKKFTIPLEQKYLEKPINKWSKELRQKRLKMLFNPKVQEIKIPTVSEWKSFLKPENLQHIAENAYYKEYSTEELVLTSVSKEYTELQFEFKMCSLVWKSLGDILAHNTIEMVVNNQMKFMLRKCTNGKYTIADINRITLEGEGFYLPIIVEALRENYPDLFDFSDSNEKGLFRYDHVKTSYEYYFESPKFLDNSVNFKVFSQREQKRKKEIKKIEA